jgi:hypothetical protein
VSIDTVFNPQPMTAFIGAAAAQILTSSDGAPYMFRVRNLSTTPQYFAWGVSAAAATAALATSPPTGVGGAASTNVIGMIGSSVETFEIPVTSWFIASTATGFEFTPGRGS